jgi:3-oxoadipate enol-lactonase
VAITSLEASAEGPAGAPVLVLGNSMGTTRAVWEPQLPPLRRHFRLLRYEFPGHGGSQAPPGPYTVGELGAAVLALLDAHGIGRASYCGISLGGMVGMWLAANAPDRVAALAVCCTSAYLPPAPFWAGRAQQARAGGTGSIAEQVVSRWFTPEFAAREPGVPASFVAGLAQVAAEGYAGCCEAIGAMDLRASLPAITAPTLVIAGAEDPATPPWHGAVIASAIPGARLAVVRGAAHLASVSAPGQVGCALLGFLLG